jgi:hypothetical protein
MICQGNTGQMHREIRQDAGFYTQVRELWREFRKEGSTFFFFIGITKRGLWRMKSGISK